MMDANLDSIKAEKTIMNCSINLLSAIEKKTFFELCSDERTRKIIDLLFEETYIVLNQLYKIKTKENLRKEFYDIVSQMRHYSSTYQDAIAKRKSEAKFLNGLIVKLGKKNNIVVLQNKKILKNFYKKYPKSK